MYGWGWRKLYNLHCARGNIVGLLSVCTATAPVHRNKVLKSNESFIALGDNANIVSLRQRERKFGTQLKHTVRRVDRKYPYPSTFLIRNSINGGAGIASNLPSQHTEATNMRRTAPSLVTWPNYINKNIHHRTAFKTNTNTIKYPPSIECIKRRLHKYGE